MRLLQWYLCAYYLGVVAVLTIGLEVGYLLDKWTHRKDYADALLLEDTDLPPSASCESAKEEADTKVQKAEQNTGIQLACVSDGAADSNKL